jgi:hypothetical protein
MTPLTFANSRIIFEQPSIGKPLCWSAKELATERNPRVRFGRAQARKRRAEIRTCGRDCLLTCTTTRTLRDKAELFLKVL